MRKTTMQTLFAACLVSAAIVSPAMAQDPPGGTTDAVVIDQDDDDGFDDWGLLGLLGLAGLLGRKRRDDVHVVTRPDPNTTRR